MAQCPRCKSIVFDTDIKCYNCGLEFLWGQQGYIAKPHGGGGRVKKTTGKVIAKTADITDKVVDAGVLVTKEIVRRGKPIIKDVLKAGKDATKEIAHKTKKLGENLQK